MKIIENGCNFRVECYHPEDATSYRDFVVDADNVNVFDDEEYDAWLKDVIKVLTDIVNRYGYWHEVIIYQWWVIKGKRYEERVN